MFEFKSSKPPFRRKILDVRIERAYDAGYAGCVTVTGRSLTLGVWTAYAGGCNGRGGIKTALSSCIS